MGAFLETGAGSTAVGIRVERRQSGGHGTGASRTWQEVPSKMFDTFVHKVFLPTEYPHSVPSNYLPFVKAMSLQMFFSHVSRVFATQAMLLAVGVGSNVALPLAAVTAWVLKDGLGHICAIIFGTLVNTRFDSDPKRYRFQAALLGKAADFFSIFTLGRPEYFLALSTLGSACGRVSAGAASSCRAKVYETFALRSNLGDVLRCTQAQTVTAQLLGTGVGACFGPVIGADMTRLLIGNAVLSAASIYAAYVSSALVQMQTLNVQRAELIFFKALQDLQHVPDEAGRRPSDGNRFQALTVQQVQEAEIFVKPYRSVFTGSRLLVNPPVEGNYLVAASALDVGVKPYILALQWSPSATLQRPFASVIWYRAEASPQETIKGFFHACMFRELLAEADWKKEGLFGKLHVPVHHLPVDVPEAVERLYAKSEEQLSEWWPLVYASLLERGWRTDVAFLDVKEFRIRVGEDGQK